MNKEKFLILLFKKENNFTSYDIIKKFKRIFLFKKISHCGTLDFSAFGLLLLFIGNTKFIKNFFNKNKRYLVFGIFGVNSDSYDIEGKIKFYNKNNYILDKKLILFNLFLIKKIGLFHKSPVFSSIKHNGVRLYKYGRLNIKILIKNKKSRIFKIFLFKKIKNLIILDIKCESGTYIRSLLDFLGKKIQIPLCSAVIYRVSVGNFNILDSFSF